MKIIEVTKEDVVDEDYRIGVKLPGGKVIKILIPTWEEHYCWALNHELDYGLNLVCDGHYC